MVHDAWLYKLEAIYRYGLDDGDYFSHVVGFEYTFFGIKDSAADLGVIAEWLYDDRNDSSVTAFENDIMLGLRYVLNDVAGSEALVGVINDLENESTMYRLEASRRYGNYWKLTI